MFSPDLEKAVTHYAPYIGGYLGSSSRSNPRDKIVEQVLASRGLGPRAIALWLSSTSARHMMDDVNGRTSPAEFRKRVEEYTDNAFEDVLIWSHPDHAGSLASTRALKEAIRAHYKGT